MKIIGYHIDVFIPVFFVLKTYNKNFFPIFLLDKLRTGRGISKMESMLKKSDFRKNYQNFSWQLTCWL